MDSANVEQISKANVKITLPISASQASFVSVTSASYRFVYEPQKKIVIAGRLIAKGVKCNYV